MDDQLKSTDSSGAGDSIRVSNRSQLRDLKLRIFGRHELRCIVRGGICIVFRDMIDIECEASSPTLSAALDGVLPTPYRENEVVDKVGLLTDPSGGNA